MNAAKSVRTIGFDNNNDTSLKERGLLEQQLRKAKTSMHNNVDWIIIALGINYAKDVFKGREQEVVANFKGSIERIISFRKEQKLKYKSLAILPLPVEGKADITKAIFSYSIHPVKKLKQIMKQILCILGSLWITCFSYGQGNHISKRVDSLLKLMTLEEKAGQLNQISNPFAATGPITPAGNYQQQIKDGKTGSMLNMVGAVRTRQLQELALQSRLKIPLLFG